MAEQVKTISEARHCLPRLSEAAQKRMARVLITNQGKPQSVLLGYDDYRGMVASLELLNRPEELKKIHDRLEDGTMLTFEQLQSAVNRRRPVAGKNADEEIGKAGKGAQSAARAARRAMPRAAIEAAR